MQCNYDAIFLYGKYIRRQKILEMILVRESIHILITYKNHNIDEEQ